MKRKSLLLRALAAGLVIGISCLNMPFDAVAAGTEPVSSGEAIEGKVADIAAKAEGAEASILHSGTTGNLTRKRREKSSCL